MCLEDSGELLGAGGLEPWVSSRKVAPPRRPPRTRAVYTRVWSWSGVCGFCSLAVLTWGGGGTHQSPRGRPDPSQLRSSGAQTRPPTVLR